MIIFQDFNTLSLKIMAVKPHSEAELEEMMINLACILKMINNSQEWKCLVTKIEQYVFDVAQNFLQIVREMVLDPDQMDTMNKFSIVLMIAHYTLKYFDMSQTEMRDGVFQALSLHVANNNSQLVKVYVAPMCLYMIEWQLKDLPSLIASNDRVAKLEQQVNDLVNALNRFLQATNSDTRTMAFKVLCRLLELFCENSEFIKGLPSSIQIQPSVQMIQWLNFNLNVLVPHNVTYTDSQKFQVAAKHLKRYCNLLSSGILDISYLSSVLPHFSLYLKDGNYNPVLRKLIEELSSNASLPSILIYSLANINIHQGQSPCKMIAEGLAHVLFSQLKEEDKLRNLNWDILYAGSSYILKNKNFSLLQPLSCFVKFITKDEAIKVKAQIVPMFSGVSNNTEVQQYLNSFPA
ncbi:uncharacterized protein LOC124374477 [Homalodisca vitripennis]|uniref:uncharacterized protein LOC124374477 n=1 Tax=Homalodisca vitripennis TaxID=197043 RepID=UPI001EEC3532|nr:uncharacterized protein LOC124374477 [Homalodisca vitripennis]